MSFKDGCFNRMILNRQMFWRGKKDKNALKLFCLQLSTLLMSRAETLEKHVFKIIHIK